MHARTAIKGIAALGARSAFELHGRDLSGWLIRDQRFLSQRLWYKHIALAVWRPTKKCFITRSTYALVMALALSTGTALPSTPTEWARNQHRFFPLLPPPPLGWMRALSKRSGAGYFLMKGHQIFEPTVEENEAAQHSSFVRLIIRSRVCPNGFSP